MVRVQERAGWLARSYAADDRHRLDHGQVDAAADAIHTMICGLRTGPPTPPSDHPHTVQDRARARVLLLRLRDNGWTLRRG